MGRTQLRATEILEGATKYTAPARRQQVDVETARTFLNQTIAKDQSPIYRGVDEGHEDFYTISPAGFSRQSANTANYTTLFVDNSPAWQAYPKRSQSIICTSSRRMGASYAFGGALYRVLPKNGSKIGVCPEDDFWGSFPKLKTIGISSIEELNFTLRDLWRGYTNYDDGRLEEKDFPTLIKQLDQLSNILEKHGTARQKGFLKHGSIVKTLEACLDPAANGFELMSIEQFSVTDEREVWTDATSLMVRVHVYDALEQGEI